MYLASRADGICTATVVVMHGNGPRRNGLSRRRTVKSTYAGAWTFEPASGLRLGQVPVIS